MINLTKCMSVYRGNRLHPLFVFILRCLAHLFLVAIFYLLCTTQFVNFVSLVGLMNFNGLVIFAIVVNFVGFTIVARLVIRVCLVILVCLSINLPLPSEFVFYSTSSICTPSSIYGRRIMVEIHSQEQQLLDILSSSLKSLLLCSIPWCVRLDTLGEQLSRLSWCHI